MAIVNDLPKGFDPEQHLRMRSGMKQKALPEGVSLLEHDQQTGFYSLTKVERSASGVVTRCWHCYKRPDGSFDCFEVSCPWNNVTAVAH